MTPILDWRSRHDPESRNYGIRTLVPSTVSSRTRLWRQGTVLDQGSEGACVGFGHTNFMQNSPTGKTLPVSVGNRYAIERVYHTAQQIDEWPGENYSGTSVLAGAKVLKARGLIGEYRWAFGIDDVRDALITTGPVVIGIPWYDSMYSTLPSGLVDRNTNTMVGGHCLLLTGYYTRKRIDGRNLEVIRWRNSWGPGYGENGTAYIELDQLEWLLQQDGEACVPTNKSRKAFDQDVRLLG